MAADAPTTTLLRDLHEHVPVTYVEFDTTAELADPLHAFLTGVDDALDGTVIRPRGRGAADPVSASGPGAPGPRYGRTS